MLIAYTFICLWGVVLLKAPEPEMRVQIEMPDSTVTEGSDIRMVCHLDIPNGGQHLSYITLKQVLVLRSLSLECPRSYSVEYLVRVLSSI